MNQDPNPEKRSSRRWLRGLLPAAAVLVAAAVGVTVWLLQPNGGDSPAGATPATTTAVPATTAPVTAAPAAVTQPEEPPLMVAVGEDGTILTSANGSGWTSQASGTDRDLRGLATNGELWVAVGAAGTILTSSDGTIWAPQASGTDGDLYAVSTDGDMWVAVGAQTNRRALLLISPDGRVWTQQTVDGPLLVGVAIDRDLWVALTGSGDILAASAPDPDASLASGPAVSWTKLESEWGLAMARAVATDGRLRLAVGGQGFLAYTTDGVAWTDSSTNGLTLNGVATSGELWVAVGDSGAVVTSDDGIDWVIRSGPANRQPDFGLTQLNGVAAGGGLWIAVGVDGFIGSSPDGIAWTRQQGSDATGIPDLLAVAIG